MNKRLLFVFILILFFNHKSLGQCAVFGTNHCATAAPTVIGNSITCTPPPANAGRRNFRVNNMIAGATYRVSNCGSGYDTQMTIRDIGNLFMDFNDDNGPACSGLAASIDFTPTTTGDYRIQLNRYDCQQNGNMSNGSILVTLISLPITNDECSGAIELASNTSCVTTAGTTVGATQTQAGCTGYADDDVWYYFTATSTEHTVTVTAGTIYDLVLEIFSGTNCSSLSSIDCEDFNWPLIGDPDEESIILTNLTVGDDYYIRVYSFEDDSFYDDTGTFNICVTEPCSPGSGNGTTSLACPSVDVVDDSSNDSVTINCGISASIDLEASYLELGETTNYNVNSIPYNPPYQFDCLANPVSVNVDDIWSPVVNLPFDFCFYGQTYNSCVIGSNGVISFDSSLAGGDSGWRIDNNLPHPTANASEGALDYFFGASIYGVHHDIDPSAGGEIGWELITLNTGCRALVAAWNDVPMYDSANFGDGSVVYSGMIVFYEDTNVIEVYIEEKQIDDSPFTPPIWNDGRAQVGLQNATGTQAVSAPGRNDITTTWTATNEAWRFTPSGASITSLRWLEDGVHNPIYDNNDMITVSPTSNTTYTCEITYNLCNATTLIETDDFIISVLQSKLWDGSQSDDWTDPLNWSDDAVPSSTDCVVIPSSGNDPIIYANDNGNGLNLTVESGATLTQQSNSTLTIVNTVEVEAGGTYNLEDSASLIQVDNVANIIDGTFTMDRNTTIRQNDYVYWSSPVNSFNIENVSPATPNGYKYEWIPTMFQGIGPPGNMLYGEWQSYNTGAMDIGKGYIIKGPSGHPNTPTLYSATFTGTPNNGIIVQSIQRGIHTSGAYTYQPYAGGDILNITNDDDNWNLIGNPYPSAIDAIDFLTNPNNTNIAGNVYLWTHGTDLGIGNTDPFYDDYIYNYSVADYLAYNSSGTSMPSGFNGYIGAGQGFFVLMTDASTVSETVTFENSMRDSAYTNDQFYRNADTSDNTPSLTHRIWLDYIDPSGNTNTTLVAYIDGATNAKDRMFDAVTTSGNGLDLYTLIGDESFLIQGRQLPFANYDQVPMGLYVTEAGNQTIAINTLQGLFENVEQDIFLEDLAAGLIHNLKESPYTFTSAIGFINDRFILRYTNNSLGIDDFAPIKGIKVYEENDDIVVLSNFEQIESIEVYDVLGRNLFTKTSINNNQFNIDAISSNNLSLFLKIRLVDGSQKIAKIIF